jgi:pyruvate carboxylase subunit B
VEKGGYGTSVTPVSQFYFQQAFNNVMFGPWKKISESYGKMVLGYFGKTPVPPNPGIIKIASEQLKLEPNEISPMQLNDKDHGKSIKSARGKLRAEKIEETEENIFIVATCGEKGLKFLKGDGEIGIRKAEKKEAISERSDGPTSYLVKVNGKEYPILFERGKATVNGKVYDVDIHEGKSANLKGVSKTLSQKSTEITAQMPGKVMRIFAKKGERIKAGESILIIEAMKMEVQITTPVEGILSDIAVSEGEQVTTGQLLAILN